MAEPIDELEAPAPDDVDADIEDIADLEEIDPLAILDVEDADAESEDVVAEEGDESEALDELEAEELEMLTEDEAAESLPVDEAEELRQLRRAAISLESAADTPGEGEFVCSSCFLVKAGIQLADKRKKICRDCA